MWRSPQLRARRARRTRSTSSTWLFFGALPASRSPRSACWRRAGRGCLSWCSSSSLAFLLVNKVYSPQYVLWLLPLAALARPRWRDLLIWQACEVFYFFAVWMHIAGFFVTRGRSRLGSTHWRS